MVPRRSFLTALASLTGVALARPSFALPASDTWDLSWLDQLTGRHKQVFAIGALRDRLPRRNIYFDTMPAPRARSSV